MSQRDLSGRPSFCTSRSWLMDFLGSMLNSFCSISGIASSSSLCAEAAEEASSKLAVMMLFRIVFISRDNYEL